MSHPNYIAKFVDQNNIGELYDHHPGFEKYWEEKIGEKAKIEKVGACATQIWEEFKKRSKKEISTTSANLLYTAIISNTLNFGASITHKRDHTAFNQIQKHTRLPNNWIETYFCDQEMSVFKNPKKEIINDTHVESFPNIKKEFIIGQIELWDSRKFVAKHKKEIKKALLTFNNPLWFLTSPSISEGKNYIYTKSEYIKSLLFKTINAKFEGDLGTTKKLWLRKEIVRELQKI